MSATSTRTVNRIEGIPIGGSQTQTRRVNVGDAERWLSAIGGSALVLYGLSRESLPGLALTGVGGSLLYRGLSGHCAAYEALNVNTAEHRGTVASVSAKRGIKVEKSVTINRSPQELYATWRNLENLPKFMKHLETVRSTGNRSHWVAKGPMGHAVEWDAEIINERPNELIAWRSLEGSEVDTAGSVHFFPATGKRGTVVKVELKYNPPGGKLGAIVAKLFGKEPEQEIREDLRHFKQLLEAGEIPTIQGQPSCRQ